MWLHRPIDWWCHFSFCEAAWNQPQLPSGSWNVVITRVKWWWIVMVSDGLWWLPFGKLTWLAGKLVHFVRKARKGNQLLPEGNLMNVLVFMTVIHGRFWAILYWGFMEQAQPARCPRICNGRTGNEAKRVRHAALVSVSVESGYSAVDQWLHAMFGMNDAV